MSVDGVTLNQTFSQRRDVDKLSKLQPWKLYELFRHVERRPYMFKVDSLVLRSGSCPTLYAEANFWIGGLTWCTYSGSQSLGFKIDHVAAILQRTSGVRRP